MWTSTSSWAATTPAGAARARSSRSATAPEGPLIEAPPEPSRRLPPQAKTLWRLRGAANALLAVVVLVPIAGTLGEAWFGVAAGAAGAYLLLAVTVIPELRHRRWRYEVREHEIDIRHGTFTVTRTIVPMRRVQHVETSRGMLEQALQLASVRFHTAAGGTEIPALERAEADEVRAQIATLARTADEL